MTTVSKGQNRGDIKALLRLALVRSGSSREALAQSIAEICLEDDLGLNAQESALLFDILHKLIRSVEKRIRRDLAQRLATRTDVPRAFIVTLANDQIEVAYPVLVESNVLEDPDLIAITGQQLPSHQIAITLREHVSPAVSEALIDTNNPDVIDSLVRNPEAKIAPATMQRLVDISRDMPPLCRPLLQRHDLDAELAWRMSGWVGEALKEFITEAYPAQFLEIEIEIDHAVREIADEGGEPRRDLASLLTKAEGEGGITAEALANALNKDDVELFEAMFARLTGVDAVAMPAIVYDPGGEPFAIACKACGIAQHEFEQLYLLLTKSLAGQHEADGEELKKLRSYYRDLDDMTVRSILSEWQQVPSKAWETA
jgi:uncharacterized protein (DUF2336 family)